MKLNIKKKKNVKYLNDKFYFSRIRIMYLDGPSQLASVLKIEPQPGKKFTSG
jgi:hypothetical protein